MEFLQYGHEIRLQFIRHEECERAALGMMNMGERGVGRKPFVRFKDRVNKSGIPLVRSNKNLVRLRHIPLNCTSMPSKSTSRRLGLWLGFGCLVGGLPSCAHRAPAPPVSQLEPAPLPVTESMESRISKLQDRIVDLETRISALNDKINLTQGVPPSPPASPAVEVVEVPAAHGKVLPPAPKRPVKPPVVAVPAASKKTSFAGDPAVDRFREAKILFDTGRYSDSIVEFSDFVRNEPDHPLAPSAQYHLGMGYLEQKEYKLAEDELNRLLLSFPHSGHVPDALLALHRVSEALKKAPRAIYYKEKLLAQFPNSPQAKSMKREPTRSEAVMPTEDEPKVIERPGLPQAPELPTTGGAGHS